MKVTFTNNSCSRLRRLYSRFELDLPGNKETTLLVPDSLVDNVERYLRTHHPAVVMVKDAADAGPAPAASSVAATITDKTVLDINVDDQETEAPSITIEQHLRSIGLLSDAPAVEEAPIVAEVAEVPAQQAAPETPKPAKKGGGNLIPAKKADKPAKTPGGKK